MGGAVIAALADLVEPPKCPVNPTAEELARYLLTMRRWAAGMWRLHRRQKREQAHFIARFGYHRGAPGHILPAAMACPGSVQP